MKKLYQWLETRETKGLFGVEVECEGDDLPAAPAGWIPVRDGSLRGHYPDQACEYVFDGAKNYAQSLLAVNRLCNAINERKPNFSFRTSVHVHVNLQDLTWNEVCTFIYTSILLENVLMRYCGENRNGNRFCLRSQDAEGFIDVAAQLFELGPRQIFRLNENNIRYSSINLASLSKYGTVEFRGMRGTSDYNVLKNWLSALNSIKQYAVNQKHIKSVNKDFVIKSPREFVMDILGDVFPHFDNENIVGDVRLAHSLSIELPYCFNEIVEEEDKKKAPKPVEFKLPPAPIFNRNDVRREAVIFNHRIDEDLLEEEMLNGPVREEF